MSVFAHMAHSPAACAHGEGMDDPNGAADTRRPCVCVWGTDIDCEGICCAVCPPASKFSQTGIMERVDCTTTAKCVCVWRGFGCSFERQVMKQQGEGGATRQISSLYRHYVNCK